MIDYAEVEDPKEIRHLNAALSTRLRSALTHTETRIIGYPQGSFEAKVHFRSSGGADVFYWSGGSSDDKTVAFNFFGHGVPGSKVPLYIDVQFNVPVVSFNRKSGGVFLRHVSTGAINLAHRGIVTLGHGRLSKSELFSEMAATLRDANTSGGPAEFLVIGEAESQTLIDDIDDFSSELRRAARALKNGKKGAGTAAHQGTARKTKVVAGKLRAYYDEFSGRRRSGGGKKSIADCYHGKVIRAIRDGFDGASETLKSVAIDLTVLTTKRAFLFEAKTSADTQSIYTAIGQLAVHSTKVAEIASGLPVTKVIVIPELPADDLCKVIRGDLGITLLTFTRSAGGHISINGLKDFKMCDQV